MFALATASLVVSHGTAGGLHLRQLCGSTPTPHCRRSHAPAMTSLALRVYIEDTDAFQVVYYANYLRFFERAAHEYAGQQECASLFRRDGLLLGLDSVAMLKYGQPAVLGDELEVTTSPLGTDSTGRLWLGQTLTRVADGQQLCSASNLALRLRTRDGLSAPWPPQLRGGASEAAEAAGAAADAAAAKAGAENAAAAIALHGA